MSIAGEKSLAEIVEFCSLLEAAVTRLACQRADFEDIQQLCRSYQRTLGSWERILFRNLL